MVSPIHVSFDSESKLWKRSKRMFTDLLKSVFVIRLENVSKNVWPRRSDVTSTRIQCTARGGCCQSLVRVTSNYSYSILLLTRLFFCRQFFFFFTTKRSAHDFARTRVDDFNRDFRTISGATVEKRPIIPQVLPGNTSTSAPSRTSHECNAGFKTVDRYARISDTESFRPSRKCPGQTTVRLSMSRCCPPANGTSFQLKPRQKYRVQCKHTAIALYTRRCRYYDLFRFAVLTRQ